MLYQHIFNQLEVLAPEIYEIFQIGRLLEEKTVDEYAPLHHLLESAKGAQGDTYDPGDDIIRHEVDQEWHVDVMSRMQDFPRILKKQFMLPDPVFDQKLISRELLVRQPDKKETYYAWSDFFKLQNRLNEKKRQKRQSTYLLIDVSGTTAGHNRFLLEKAICLRFIEENQRDKGSLFLRFFNHQSGPLVSSVNGEKPHYFWSELMRPLAPFGGTNLQKAMLDALQDIHLNVIDTETELLVITDGLARVDKALILEKNPDVKIHFVIIGNDMPDLSEAEMRDLFEKKMTSWKEKWEHQLDQQEYAKHLKAMEDKFWSERFTEQKRYYQDLKKILNQISSESGGTCIEIPDLDNKFFSSGRILTSLREEIAQLSVFLHEQLPISEKEKLLERIMSLQNYINFFAAKQKGRDKETQNNLAQISDELSQIIESDEEFLEILKYAQLKMKMSPEGQLIEISMAKLFKILFKKIKYYYYRYKS